MKVKSITTIVTLAVIITSATFTGCKSSKNVAKTPQQKAAVARGIKLDKEECEEEAFKSPKRASGIGTSQSERLAKNSAVLDARANLVAAIQSVVMGMIKNFDLEHQVGANMNKASDFVNQTGEEQKALIDAVISSRITCSNTYAQVDGSYRVYACVELNDESIANLYQRLSRDKKISIEYEEIRFREEMEEGLDEFRNRE
jgi:hypothetical protein